MTSPIKSAGHVAAGGVARAHVLGDLLLGPGEAGILVGGDVGDDGILGPLGVPGQGAGVVHGLRHAPGCVALGAVADDPDQILPAGQAGGRGGAAAASPLGAKAASQGAEGRSRRAAR